MRVEGPELAVLLAGAAAAAIAGAAVAFEVTRPLAAGLGACAFGALLLSPARGILVGLLALAALNGLPGVDLSAAQRGLRGTDVAVLGLLACCAFKVVLEPPARLPRHLRLVLVWSAALAAWWAVAFLRAVVGAGAPFVQAGFFGRDFLYFALLVPALMLCLQSRRDVVQLLGFLAAAAAVLAAGAIYIAVTGEALPILIHIDGSNEVGTFTRIYAAMNYLIVAAFPMAIGVALLAWGRRPRLAAAALVPLAGVAFLLQFTRASYFGLGIGFAVAIVVAVLSAGTVGAANARRVAARLVLVAATCAAVFVAAPDPEPGSGSPLEAVESRLVSGIEEVTGRSEGTLGYRADLARDVWRIVGDDWPIGLGFVPPSFRYESTLPGGGIRNPDIGALNAIGTMGVIGALLLYVPVLATLVLLLRRLLGGSDDDGATGLRLGMALWLVATVASSVTLVTLFSVSGLALTSLVLAVALRLDDDTDELGSAPALAPAAARVLAPVAAPPPAARPRPAPSLGVVVVTYNSAATIAECLRSVAEHLPGAEVVVVDNASTDGSAAAARAAAPGATVVETGANLGFGRGCNVGVARARSERILLLNPDAVITASDGEALAATLERRPFGLAAGLVEREDGAPVHLLYEPTRPVTDFARQVLRPLLPRRIKLRAPLTRDVTTGWLSAAVLLVDRREFLSLGGFDERFFLYWEDRDLSRRYRDAGLPFALAPALICAHHAGGSSAGDPLRVAQYGWAILSWIEFQDKWAGRRAGRRAARAALSSLGLCAGVLGAATALTRVPTLARKRRQMERIRAFVVAQARAGGDTVPGARRHVSELAGR